ncbi:hypothetical protein WJX74_001062 [Apatococcus lobatus]|uniref:[Histone H3]-trimethyl-L-lysine(9) demethylase n=2 Tax=Apatococcus TaxID=904362 RepID=A0AAW1TF63_9CHLO
MALSDGGSGSRREEARVLAQVDAFEQTAAKSSKKEAKLREADINRQAAASREAQLLAQAAEGGWLSDVDQAPTFRPTLEEFESPLRYIEKVRVAAAPYGICKIIPPVAPAVPAGLVLERQAVEGRRLRFPARIQEVKRPDWKSFDTPQFWVSPRTYTVSEFEKFAEDFQRRLWGIGGCVPPRLVETEYWRAASTSEPTQVSYGTDVEGSAFCQPHTGDPMGSSRWNLQTLPKDAESTLRLIKGEIPGVTAPMLYFGMLFATFAWHVEDHNLYSINYHHLGAPKTWYGVPETDADSFEQVVRDRIYTDALRKAAEEGRSDYEQEVLVQRTLLEKTTMFSPQLLLQAGVKVYRMVQYPGELVITFPRAYHSGFSNGFNVGEAVNFATGNWFPYGADACERYRHLARLPVLPHEQLLCQEARHLRSRMHSGQRHRDSAFAHTDATVRHAFIQLMQLQNEQRQELMAKGAVCQEMPASITTSMPCGRCRHMAYVSLVLDDHDEEEPAGTSDEGHYRCLSCALADPSCGPSAVVMVRSNLDELEGCAHEFEGACLEPPGDLEHLQRTGSSISDSYADDSIHPPQLQETWHQLDLLQQQRQHQQMMEQGRMGWDPDFMADPGHSLTFPGGSLSRSQGPLGAGKHLGIRRSGLGKPRPSLPKAAAAAAAAAAMSGGSEPSVMPNQCHRSDGKGWRCPFPSLPGMKMCIKHSRMQQRNGPDRQASGSKYPKGKSSKNRNGPSGPPQNLQYSDSPVD